MVLKLREVEILIKYMWSACAIRVDSSNKIFIESAIVERIGRDRIDICIAPSLDTQNRETYLDRQVKTTVPVKRILIIK